MKRFQGFLTSRSAACLAAAVALTAVVAASSTSNAGWSTAIVLVTIGIAGGAVLSCRAGLRGKVEAADAERMRLIGQIAISFQRLARSRDVETVVARVEALGRRLLSCDQVALALGREAERQRVAPAAAGFEQTIGVFAADGQRFGRLSVSRLAPAFTASEDMLLEHLARAAGAALDNVKVLNDATRIHAEAELMLSRTNDGLFTLDAEWRIKSVNAAALRYLHRTSDEMIGARLLDIFPPDEAANMPAQLRASAEGRIVEFAYECQPVPAVFDMRAYPSADGLTVQFRDVTAQRETEARLRQSQKLEAIGQLTGGIAHDVNNLLTVMIGNLESLAARTEEQLPVGTDRSAMRNDTSTELGLAVAGLRAGESAAQLIHRLLAYSRRQPLSPRVVDVEGLLASLEPLIKRTLAQNVTLRISCVRGLGKAQIDPSELESSILNMALNAQDAMPSGGRLDIMAENVEVDRVYARVAGLEKVGSYVMLSVADTGTGMPPDVIQKAFDPFFTTKEAGKGTGLGLSMVYGFARQSGGQVTVESEVGRGTIFRLYLPRTDASAAPHAPQPSKVEGGQETILLVEDNGLVRAHTEAMLKGLGYRVVAAEHGGIAVAEMERGLRPELVFTDVVLPAGMTGLDVADAAARLVPGVRVLFTSGYSGNVLLRDGRLTPGVSLLGKPFRRSELAERVRAQLAAAPWVHTDR